MKLVVFCLFAVFCCSLAIPILKTRSLNKLKETLDELRRFKKNLTNVEQMEKRVNTPPKDIGDCGCLSALKCFEEGVSTFNSTPYQIKLFRSLRNPLTADALQFCATDSTPSCSECKSHPTESVDHFLSQLESLIQKGIAKLKMG